MNISGGPASGPNIDGCSFIADIVPGDRGTAVSVANAAPHITASQIRFGATTGATNAVALDIYGPLPGDVIVEDTTITAGDAADQSQAIFATMAADSAGGLLLRNVTATSGTAAESEVLELLTAPRVLAENCVFSARAGSVRCHVVGEDNSEAQLSIRNSVLQVGSGPAIDCETVQVEGRTALEITNSVIIGPTGGAPPLRLREGHPIVTNTIIVAHSGTTCVDQPWEATIPPGRSTPTSFQNNALVACTQAYVIANSDDGDPPPTIATTGSAVDSFSGLPLRSSTCTDPNCPQARFVANLVLPGVSLADVFVDVDGPDNDLRTVVDNDYHLRATANIGLRQGGLGPGVAACAPLGQFASCNVPPLDFDGQTRTAPYSIGPDEAP